MSWRDVSFILRSGKRKMIILLETPRTPTQLSKLMKASLPNISLKLGDLVRRGLVECLNPRKSKGRIYRLTERGERVLRMIKRMEGGAGDESR